MIPQKSSAELRLMEECCDCPEIRKPLIPSDTVVHIQEPNVECNATEAQDEEDKASNFYLACVVTGICCPLLGLCAIYASILSKRALIQRDHSRAESCSRTSLWISLSGLVIGGFFWAGVGAVVLLKLKGYDFTYILYS